MAKKPATTEEADTIARGMEVAREIDEEDGRQIAEDVVEEAAEPKLPLQPTPRTRKTFDHTGVQPQVEPTPGIFEPPDEAEPVPMMAVTTCRSLTMGDVVHPEGATITVPTVYAESLIKSGAAVVAVVEPEEPVEPEPGKKKRQAEDSPDPDEE